MDTQLNFLSLITTALNTYIEQQVNAALAKATPATPPVDEAAIKALIDTAVGEKITELFEGRIAEMIDEKMESAIESAIEQHTQDETHGDIDFVAQEVIGSRKFTYAIESAIEEAMETHTSDYDHDELANIGDRLTEDEIDEKLQDYADKDSIKELIEERVGEAVGTVLAQTTFRLTTAG